MAATKSVIGQPELSSDYLKMNIGYVLMYYRGSTRSHSHLYVSCKSAACKQCFWADLLKCSDRRFYICSGSQRGFFSSVEVHLYSFKRSALNADSLGHLWTLSSTRQSPVTRIFSNSRALETNLIISLKRCYLVWDTKGDVFKNVHSTVKVHVKQ